MSTKKLVEKMLKLKQHYQSFICLSFYNIHVVDKYNFSTESTQSNEHKRIKYIYVRGSEIHLLREGKCLRPNWCRIDYARTRRIYKFNNL